MELEEKGEVVAVLVVDPVVVDEIATAVQDGRAVVELDTWQAVARFAVIDDVNCRLKGGKCAKHTDVACVHCTGMSALLWWK